MTVTAAHPVDDLAALVEIERLDQEPLPSVREMGKIAKDGRRRMAS